MSSHPALLKYGHWFVHSDESCKDCIFRICGERYFYLFFYIILSSFVKNINYDLKSQGFKFKLQLFMEIFLEPN